MTATPAAPALITSSTSFSRDAADGNHRDRGVLRDLGDEPVPTGLLAGVAAALENRAGEHELGALAAGGDGSIDAVDAAANDGVAADEVACDERRQTLLRQLHAVRLDRHGNVDAVVDDEERLAAGDRLDATGQREKLARGQLLSRRMIIVAPPATAAVTAASTSPSLTVSLLAMKARTGKRSRPVRVGSGMF